MYLRPFEDQDVEAVEPLLDRCFGPGRHLRTAARLRAGRRRLRGLSFTAEEAGCVLGAVQCWPLLWVPETGPARRLVLLGPLAVEPALRGRGIGVQLMTAVAEALDARALPAMLIGDQPYYGRWGFSPARREFPGSFRRYCGDLVSLGKGEILHWTGA